MRASMIYGGATDNNLERLVGLIRRFPIHPLINGGQMKWQPVFTHDVVAAIVAALANPIAIGKEYTLAGPEPITYRQMVETIARGLNRKITFVPVPIGAAKSIVRFYQSHSKSPRIRLDQIQRLEEDKVFDISDAVRDLRFAPISFEEGIRRKLARMA
jgi:nucleoside-diphosphate-sugar epimerase